MTTPLHTLRDNYRTALRRFISSSKAFEVLNTVNVNPTSEATSTCATPNVLYVLDSSFNPPTVAHLGIAGSAFLENPSPSSRLLLLLATQNADKPSKPAPFEDRLAMMEVFARDLLSYLTTKATGCVSTPAGLSSESSLILPQVDIGVTKKPYFVDKAVEIEASGVYPNLPGQVHLIGYDTLIRIFNSKYYPPDYTLAPLVPFLAQHRLRVTVRPDDEWGGTDDQLAFLHNVARGGLGHEGGRSEWAQRIQFVEGKKPGELSVSSTKAREIAKARVNLHVLELLVPRGVCDYLVSQHPYDDSSTL